MAGGRIGHARAAYTTPHTNSSLSETSMMLPYKYTPLSSPNPSGITPSDLYIRLVQLPAGELDGNLSCSMEPYNLSTAPKYEALSYCWSDPNNKAEVTCDGRRLEIQGNLRDFLLRTRAKGNSPMLCIDAICVNQADDQEKSGQVMGMRAIYKSAARTLIWLGNEENDSTRGWTLLRGYRIHSMPRSKARRSRSRAIGSRASYPVC
jgi:hypothetical protein